MVSLSDHECYMVYIHLSDYMVCCIQTVKAGFHLL